MVVKIGQNILERHKEMALLKDAGGYEACHQALITGSLSDFCA
jgi:hypothetical protein